MLSLIVFHFLKRLGAFFGLRPATRKGGSQPLPSPSPVEPDEAGIVTDSQITASSLKAQFDQLINHYTALATGLVEEAFPDGVKGIPRNGGSLTSTERKIINGYHYAVSRLDELTGQARSRIEHRLQRLRQRVNGSAIADQVSHELATQDQVARKQIATSLPSTQLGPRLRWWLLRHRHVAGVVAHLQDKRRQLAEACEVADNHFHSLVHHRYRQKPPIKGIMDYGWVVLIIVTLLFGVEIAANFSSFQELGLGDNNLAAMGLAAFFAVFLAVCAKALGFAIRTKSRGKLWLFSTLCFVLCLMISGSRLTMEAGIMTKGVYLLVNFLITGATVLASWAYAGHHDYFTVKGQRDRFRRQMAKIDYQLERLNGAVEAEQKALTESSKQRRDRLIAERTEQLEARISHNEESLHQISELRDSGRHRLEEQCDASLEDYRLSNNRARSGSGHPVIMNWFQGWKNTPGKVAVWLLLLSLGLSACGGQPDPLPEAHVEVLFDITSGEHTAYVEAMSAFILDQLDAELKAENRSDISVTLSTIGETSTASTRTVALPASESFWSRNQKQHKLAPQHFRAELQAALQGLVQTGEAKRQSSIHRNLVNRASALMDKPGRKLILTWSDLILNEREVSFYRYERHPQKIGLERDTLLAQLTRRYDMPVLDGVTIINTYQPVLAEDDIHEEAKAFFHYYWHDVKGAEVVFQTNLALPASAGELSK